MLSMSIETGHPAMRAKATLAALLMIAAGTLGADAQTAQTRYDLMPRKPGGASDFVPNVQSNPAQVIATPSRGVGPTGSSAGQDSLCRERSGFYVAGASQGYCDFRATSLSTGPCECGTYSFYQHYTVSLSGRGAYEEVVTGCPVCPPPLTTGGGAYCGVTGYGEPVPCSTGGEGYDYGGGGGGN